ncbi:MAG: hypothetical protein LBP36_01580 [Oscillospiraceae bacterium]|nr:hypothetical protein [Oscillospiraceae bacterium]
MSNSFFRGAPEETGKSLRFRYIKNNAKSSEISVCLQNFKRTIQGYKKYLKNLNKPNKYAELLANMKKILAEDVFNKTYRKQRMYEKLKFSYGCTNGYNTFATV